MFFFIIIQCIINLKKIEVKINKKKKRKKRKKREKSRHFTSMILLLQTTDK
jgi:hypothetical protein